MRDARIVFASLVVIGTLLRANIAGAESRARAFADIPYGAAPATVAAAMRTMGLQPFVVSSVDESLPLDQRFEGRLKDQDVLVTASYDPAQHLEKLLISFLTPDDNCVSFYRALKKELQQKYGTPVTDIERWDFPYDKGAQVGQEHIALRVGKGHLAAVWDDADAGSTEGGIVVTTADNVIVQLAFESSKCPAEAARRRKILEALPDPSSAISAPAPGSDRGLRVQGID